MTKAAEHEQGALRSTATSSNEPTGAWSAEARDLLPLFEQAPGFVSFMRGPSLVVELVNRAYLQLVGHRDVVGKPIREALPEVEGQGFFELLDEVYRSGKPFAGRGMRVVLQGEPKATLSEPFVDFVYQPIRGADGDVIGILVHGHDVTEAKEQEGRHLAAERARQRADERYRGLLSSMDDGFCVIEIVVDDAGNDVDYRFLEANAAFETHTGLTDAVGKTVYELVPGLDAGWVERYGAVARTGKAIRFESHVPTMGRTFDVYANRVGDPDDRQVALVFKDITERRQGEQERERLLAEIKAERLRLSTILATIEEGVMQQDADGVVRFSNIAAERLLGLSAEQMAGRVSADPSWGAVHEDGSPWPGDDHPPSRALRTGRGVSGETMGIQRGDGRRVWLSVSAQPMVGDDGRSTGVVATFSDITARLQAERAQKELVGELRTADERYRLATRATQDAIWDWDLETNLIVWNDGVRRLFGYDKDDVSAEARWWVEGIHPDDRARVLAGIHAVIDGPVGDTWNDDYRFRRKDGSYAHVEDSGQVVRRADGKSTRMVGAMHDVTERKAHAALLVSQRERYQALFAEAPVAIALLTGPKFVFELMNPLCCEMFGLTAEQVIGKPVLEALPELVGQGFDVLLENVRTTGVPFVANEMLVPRARGLGGAIEAGYFNFVYQPLRGDGGIEAIVCVATEVTAQVRSRQLAVDKGKTAQFGADVGAALTAASPLATQLQGCCEAMVALGGYFARIWVRNEQDPVLELQASAGRYTQLDGGHARVPVGQFKIGLIASEREPHLTNAVLDDPRVGDPAWARREGIVSFAGYPLIVGDKLVGVMAMFGREAMSDEVLVALQSVATPVALAIERSRGERFRELFIGMLGHDLRNPLSAIVTGVQVMALQPGATERTKKSAARILGSSMRMSRMVTQLLDYTRARSGGGIPAVPLPGDLFAVARDVVAEVQEAHPTRVIELSTSGNGAGVFDGDRMAQVLSNLVGNAISYGDPERPVRVVVQGRDEGFACEVLSFGVPIDEATLPDIFDPFRRGPRGVGTKGLGLGLFITREIIFAHRGIIEVSSSAQAGTSFRFNVPKASPENRP